MFRVKAAFACSLTAMRGFGRLEPNATTKFKTNAAAPRATSQVVTSMAKQVTKSITCCSNRHDVRRPTLVIRLLRSPVSCYLNTLPRCIMSDDDGGAFPYTVTRRLGQGAFGEVVKVVDNETGEEHACKRIFLRRARGEGALAACIHAN